MRIKKCSKCKSTKDFTEFNKNKSTHDGLAPECKTCRSEAARKKTKTALGIEKKKCGRKVGYKAPIKEPERVEFTPNNPSSTGTKLYPMESRSNFDSPQAAERCYQKVLQDLKNILGKKK